MLKTSYAKWIARGIEFLVVLTGMGCVTVPKTETVSLPVTLQQSFGACKGREGAAQLAVETKEGVFHAEADWVAKMPSGWDLELTNPMGQPLLLLRYKAVDGSFASSGRLAEHIPQLGVDENGFLTVAGYFAGVQPEELACFFGFVLPASWLDRAYEVVRAKDEIRFMSYDRQRRIEVTARNFADPEKRKVCARISWSHFVGAVRRQGTLCIQGASAKTATLEGFSDWRILWRNTPGSGNES